MFPQLEDTTRVTKKKKTTGAIAIEVLTIPSKLMMLRRGDSNQDSNPKTIFLYSKILIYLAYPKLKKLGD